jgi:hypothetical protein
MLLPVILEKFMGQSTRLKIFPGIGFDIEKRNISGHLTERINGKGDSN